MRVNNQVVEASASPIVVIESSEVELRSGPSGGPEVARIDVENENGLTGRFWVSVRIKNGRPVLQVSTKFKGDRQVTKTLTGAFNRV